MKKRLVFMFLMFIPILIITQAGQATTFSNLVAFGDSLTDNGNNGRYTDGDIWVESLANSLGVELYNYAYGGATTGTNNWETSFPKGSGPDTGLQWQVTTGYDHTSLGLITDTSLVTVWAGGNDFLWDTFLPTPFGATGIDSASTAAANMGSALEVLYGYGARSFMVPNLPDIGSTPSFQFLNSQTDTIGIAVYATAWTAAYNTALASQLSIFASTRNDATLYDLDIYSAFSAYTVGSDAWTELFWKDGFHPSSSGHELIYGNAASAVPEPTTILLFGTGIVGLAAVGRKRKK